VVVPSIVRRDVMGENTAVINKDAQITNTGLVQVLW
jgi:hypothetical protein